MALRLRSVCGAVRTASNALFAPTAAPLIRNAAFMSTDAADGFAAAYGTGPDRVLNWMKSYYQDPIAHSRFLRPVLQDLISAPADKQLLSGAPSLSTAWFFSKAFANVPFEERVSIFYDTSMVANSSESVVNADGQLDTLVRALYLMNDEETDGFLQQHVDICLSNLAEFAASAKPEEKERITVNEMSIKSILPEPSLRRRGEIWTWPLPAFDLEAFEDEVHSNPFPIMACTRETFLECYRLRMLRAAYPPEYDRALPVIASSISGAIHDSLWSVYFATGESACIFRLVDMAACSFERYQSLKAPGSADGGLGHAIALMKSSASNDVRSVVKQLPTKSTPTILYIMTGLSACWSLIENAKAHASVCKLLATTRTGLQRRAETQTLTAEEARALNVLQLLDAAGDPHGHAH